MNLTQRDIGDARLIEVQEERIDASVAIQFKDRMREMSNDGPKRIVLDMSAVEFLDSSGLGAVVAAMKQVGPGRKLELSGLTAMVEKVFKLTRMDTVFTIYPDTQSAFGGGLANAS